MIVVESRLVNILYKRARRKLGSASRYHEDLPEDLKRADDVQDSHEEQHRTQHREGDEAKFLPGVRAVQRGGFVILRRNLLNAGEQHHHRTPDRPPESHQNNGGHRKADVADPGDFDAEGSEQRVEKTELAVVEPTPQHSGYADRNHRRHEKSGAIESLATVFYRAQPHCDHERRHDCDRSRQNHKLAGCDEGLPEVSVRKRLLIVLNPDEGRRDSRHQLPLAEAQDQPIEERKHEKHRKQEEIRSRKEVPGVAIQGFRGCHRADFPPMTSAFFFSSAIISSICFVVKSSASFGV